MRFVGYTLTLCSLRSIVGTAPTNCRAGLYGDFHTQTCLECPTGTYCSSNCLNACMSCPLGTTTFSVGQSACESDHSPGWSYMGCVNSQVFIPYDMQFSGKAIEECYDEATNYNADYFAIQGDSCLLILTNINVESLPLSPDCTKCNSTTFQHQKCGSGSAVSLYQNLQTTFLGIFNYTIASSKGELVILQKNRTYPSIARCYLAAYHAGYAYYGVENGTTCVATNDANLLSPEALLSNDSGSIGLIPKLCRNEDPCGGKLAFASYSIDVPRLQVKETTTINCFQDSVCRSGIIPTIVVLAAVVLLTLVLFSHAMHDLRQHQLGKSRIPNNDSPAGTDGGEAAEAMLRPHSRLVSDIEGSGLNLVEGRRNEQTTALNSRGLGPLCPPV